MKKNLFTIAAGVAFVSAVSCSVEEKNLVPETDLRVPMEFTAGIGTKTQLYPDHSVVWSEGDVISIFDGENNNDFTINGEGGAASATFTGKALPDAAAYYALYPHSADAKLIDNVISSTLPSEQTVTAEATFATMVNPSVAVAAENSLTFKNIASILQVNVCNLAEGQKVTGISAKADKSLAGAYTVNPSASEPAAVASGSENTGVSLAGEITDLNGDNQYTYSMVVLPGSYNDLTVTVTYSDGSKSTFTASSAVDMPVSDGRTISIDASQAEAPAEETLYDKFMAGESIVIGGKEYNKSDFPEGNIKRYTAETKSSIFSKSTAYGDGMIVFVDSGVNGTTPSFTGDGSQNHGAVGQIGNIIIVGNDPENKPILRLTDNRLCAISTNTEVDRGDISRAVFANIKFDFTYAEDKNYVFQVPAGVDYGQLVFDNCEMSMINGKQNFLTVTQTSSIKEIVVVNSNISVPASTANTFFFHSGAMETPLDVVTFENNVLYCENGMTHSFRLISSQTDNTNKTPVANLKVNNNTFINILYNNSALLVLKSCDNMTINKNLIYFDEPITIVGNYLNVINCVETDDTGSYIGYPESANCFDNIVYQGTNEKTFRMAYWTAYAPSGEYELPRVETTDPFEGGDLSTFTPAPAYAEYGAQR